MTFPTTFVAALATFGLLAACGDSDDAVDWAGGGSGSSSADAGSTSFDTAGSSSDTAGSSFDTAGSSSDTVPSDTSGPSPDTMSGVDEPPPAAGQMTAGEWRDLDEWSYYRGLFDEPAWSTMESRWTFDTAQRARVNVVDADGLPVNDAAVELVDANEGVVFRARTDNAGRANVYANLTEETEATPPYAVHVKVAGQSAVTASFEFAGLADEFHDLDVVLDGTVPAAAAALDLMFVIDTTSSMSDEMNFLKAELESVISNVDDASGHGVDIRLSLNYYRDHGDDYVVEPMPFTTDIGAALADLRSESASGGGDTPEAVEEALADAIEAHSWRASARARLLFLVLDAPPHSSSQHLAVLRRVIPAAAEAGIRIIPVTASGIDKPTEFLTRVMAIVTGGTYVFITDDSGIGNAHIESHLPGPTQTIGTVEIEKLNDLLPRVINGYLTEPGGDEDLLGD